MTSTLGQRFLQARLSLGSRRGKSVTQAEAGNAAGVTGAAVGGYEADKSEPSLSVIDALADFYKVRKLWLAFDEGPMLEEAPEESRPPLVEVERPAPRSDAVAARKRRAK